jgi:enoyl-CoA hydratase
MCGPTRVRQDVADRIAVLTIARPEASNALDSATLAALHVSLADLAGRDDVGVIIFTGAGDRVFVGGGDVREIQARQRDDALAAKPSGLFSTIERLPKPTIAAINGAAIGGGCELALACDLRIAAEHARFGQPELNLGILPAAGATQRLPRVIGLGRAKELVLLGDPIDAQTALAWGLISAVVPAASLMTAARAYAARLLTRAPLAMRLARAALNASASASLESGLLIEALAQAICFESPDKREGTRAFLEKRTPSFER